jgi:hypothetical protein
MNIDKIKLFEDGYQELLKDTGLPDHPLVRLGAIVALMDEAKRRPHKNETVQKGYMALFKHEKDRLIRVLRKL